MARRFIFDIEANGLVPGEIVKLHCCHLKDIDTGKVLRFRHNAQENTIPEAVQLLQNADLIIGHNIIKYDIPVLQQFFPWFKPGAIFDTIIGSRLVYTDIKDRDYRLVRSTQYPPRLIGSHSLEAWGYRLMNYKDDYSGGWEEWNPEMDDYCVQDLEVTHSLYKNLLSKGFSDESFELEMAVAKILYRQELNGFLFDQKAAAELYAALVARKLELTRELQAAFPAWEVKTPFTPKANNKTRGYVKGVPTVKTKLVEFNPGSRDHISYVLIQKYGWKPTAFTDDGKPQVDETILDKLPYPEAKPLSEYLMVAKRLGQLAEGNKAWLKLVKPDGRIHGRVTTNGATTGRMTHQDPNMAQVPAGRSPYGHECRALFTVAPGKVLVGADASGLEVRCLAHYMGRWDNGEYAKIVLEGDIHTANQKAAGIETRDTAKTFFYAWLYGAGDEKIGTFFGGSAAKGKAVKQKFLNGLPALKKLVSAVKYTAQTKKQLRGLDGRLLQVRHQHAALNTLLQGAGAIVMKKALVILDADLQAAGLIPEVHYGYCVNVHDEIQIECDEDKAEFIGQTMVKAITKAGEYFKFRCKLDGEYKIGHSWADTH